MDSSDRKDSLSEIFVDCVRKEIREFLDYRNYSRSLFKLDTFNKFMNQNKNKYPLSDFYIENIPKVIRGIKIESKFGTDKWFGIPYLSERQQYNLIKGMQDFFYEALVERFCKITFSKCDNSIKSDDGEDMLLMINNIEDLYSIALAKHRKYVVPYFDHMFKIHTCGICREQFVENKLVFQLNCKHAFHFSCFNEWFIKKTNCPHCEEPVVSKCWTEWGYKIKFSNYGYKYVDIFLISRPKYV